ncbi:MAG: hypothetical protein E7457_02670 [Ruminococcaceae bacterium]|nr:hypothetical protein [Oscillospiraceae bacterium]
MWNALDIFVGCLFPFIIGGAIRYASRKWAKPLLVTVCLIFAVIVGDLVITVINSTLSAYLRKLELRVAIFAIMILGAMIADLIYRIRSRHRQNKGNHEGD